MNKYLVALKLEVKNRARIYYFIYQELIREVGEEKAVAILKRAIYKRGKEKGLLLAKKVGEPDLQKLARTFMEGKEEIDVFGHEVVRVDADLAHLRLNACPLVEAWRELDLSPEEIRIMCDFSYQVDFGKFEAAGYRLEFGCRIAAGENCCDLMVTR